MAIIYLRGTTGSDANDGSSWALAKLTLTAAITAAGSGGTVYVAPVHNESYNNPVTITGGATPDALVKVVCVNDSANPPTAAATGARWVNTANTTVIAGFFYFQGIALRGGSGAAAVGLSLGNGNSYGLYFENCQIATSTTVTTVKISLGVAGATSKDGLIVMDNTTVRFGSTAQSLTLARNVRWINTPAAIDPAGAFPVVLFLESSGAAGTLECRGVDFSALGSSSSLVSPNATGSNIAYKFASCKLGTSVLLKAAQAIDGPGQGPIIFDNCDSAGTNYRMAHYKYQGSILAETVKVRTGGATDLTQPISWNMTTLAPSFFAPLESPMIAFWNDLVGAPAKTISIEIAQDAAAAALTNADIWLEVEYPGVDTSPMARFTRNRAADVLASPSTHAASTAAWPNLTTPTKQKLSVTFTPLMKGYCIAKIMLAKPGVTVYVDPFITEA